MRLVKRNHQSHMAGTELGDFAEQGYIAKADVLGEHAKSDAALDDVAGSPRAAGRLVGGLGALGSPRISGQFIVGLGAADNVPRGLLAYRQRESARRDDGGSHESDGDDEASLHARKRTTADADCCADSQSAA